MSEPVRLGIRANLAQFTLLVIVNAFVGAMVGLERTILPAIAEHDFHLAARTAILSFIVVFGVTKALTNYFAGRFSDALGRKPVLVGGWLVAAPVPFLLMWAPSWNWVLVANVLLGVSQGLTWSTTVIMKIDLAGPEAARPRDGAQRVRRLSRGRGLGARDRLHRRDATGCGRSRSTWASGSSRWGWCSRRSSCARRTVTRATKRAQSCRGADAALAARGLPADVVHRSRPLERQSGGPRQQPERRHGVGPLPAVLRRRAHDPGADRLPRRDLSGRLGHRPALHRARSPTASGASG